MNMVIGWGAIVLALLALVPGIVPGAVSVFGVMISLLALALSLFSVKKCGKKYFRATAIIVLAGVFLLNDALRIWGALSLPLTIKLSLYGIVFLALGVCSAIARKLAPAST